jgi:hypothetical protein
MKPLVRYFQLHLRMSPATGCVATTVDSEEVSISNSGYFKFIKVFWVVMPRSSEKAQRFGATHAFIIRIEA